MKTKRFLSVLLALALCLGMLPGTTLAETDTSSTLPEGYQQMYFKSDSSYTTNIEFALNYSTALNGKLFSAQNSESSITITSSALSFSTTGLGALVTPPDGNIVWDTYSNAVAGTSGFLLFESETEKYAIAVSIYAPSLDPVLLYDDKSSAEFIVTAGNATAFTFPPHIYLDGSLTRITNENYTFTCDAAIGTLFWHEEYNELGINTSGVTNTATGKIYATSKTDSTKVFSCTVTVRPPHTPSTYPFKLYDAAKDGNVITLNSSGQYVVNVVPGKESVVYARVVEENATFVEGTNYTILDDDNTAVISSELISSTVLKITHHGNMDSSSMGVGRPLTVGTTSRPLIINFVSTSYCPFALYDSAEGGSEIPKNSDGWYSVGVSAGQDTVVYARPHGNDVFEDDTEFEITTFGDEQIAALGVLSDDKKLLTITIHGTEALKMDGCGSPLTVDGITRPLNIDFVDTNITYPFKLYDALIGGNEIAPSNGIFTVNYYVDTEKSIFLRINSDEAAAFSENCVVEFVVGEGFKLVYSELINEGKTLKITHRNGDGSGCTITSTLYVGEEEIPFTIKFVNVGTSPDDDSSDITITSTVPGASRDLVSSDVCPDLYTRTHYGAFTLPASYNDPTTYYMVPSSIGSTYPHLNGDSSSNDPQTRLQFIDFWVALGDNSYERVTDATTLNNIQEAFDGSLKMQLMVSPNDSPVPTAFPEIYNTTEVDSWRLPIKANFDFDCEGSWLYVATGTINGQTVTASVRSTIIFEDEIIFAPDLFSDTDVITQVNQFLNTVEFSADSRIIINLPAGEFDGYIDVPERLWNINVFIYGANPYNHSEAPTTILHGGIQCLNRRVRFEKIHFIGAGSGNGDKTWKDKESVNYDRPNYAFYGYGGGVAGYCIFENYYCALLTTNEMKVANHTQFINNQTAYCYDSAEWGGSPGALEDNLYKGNEIAIHFAQMTDTDRIGLSIFGISGSWFIDNKTDLRNDIKRNIYIPGNYFAYTDEDGNEAVRECQYLPVAKGNSDKTVHYYPQATDRTFTSWIYDTKFYTYNPVISVNHAATYAIPAKYLTATTITVMNEDVVLADWTFKEEEE